MPAPKQHQPDAKNFGIVGARKLPARRDSQAKLERIIDAAIRLLDDHEIADLNMSMIARTAIIPRTSIYDFFPTVLGVYEEVARRYFLHSQQQIIEDIRWHAPRTRAELVDACIDAATAYFNNYPAARKTLLATGALELHIIDNEFDILAARIYREFDHSEWPITPFSVDDPYRTLAILQSALYGASVQRHGLIEPYMVEQAKIMSHSYMTAMLASMGIKSGAL